MDGNYDIKLHTAKEIAIKQFQQCFNGHYPFLKIEIAKNNLLKPSPFNKIDFNYLQPLNIEKDRTIAQLEKDFKDLFYLSAQVFRKSGNVWVETSLTDDWTLEHQNNEGELISILFQ